jgi:hypothetical protein
MELVDMKRPEPDKKSEDTALPADSDGGYPWGLQIRLEDEELTALGIDKLPQVGAEVHIVAVATVTTITATADRSNEWEKRCATMQITSMALKQDPEKGEKPGEKDTAKDESGEMKPRRRLAATIL